MNDEFYYLGKITKLYSYKGEVVFYFDVDDVSDYKNLDVVFIDIKGDVIPFMIEKISFSKSNAATVKLMDIDTEADARHLLNSSLYLPIETLPKLDGNKFYFHEVIGFEIWDKEHGYVGVIERIIDDTAQPIFEIKDNYTEILLPIVDHFIDKVDRKEKKIHVIFPDGLLELYRDEEDDDEDDEYDID
ncbi:MAG: 16S rRNA processing protein RimM [Bacteroidales bacterium]|nr:16S rRNA processing protein RimM [Bacteroidales bacterium]